MPESIPAEFAVNPLTAYLDADDRRALADFDDVGGEDAMLLIAVIARNKLDAMRTSRGQTLDLEAARRAMAWAHEAAVRGLPSAAFNLGNFHFGGDAGGVDEARAVFWFETAIDRTDGQTEPYAASDVEPPCRVRISALVNLAGLLLNATTVARDPERALALCREAASLGDAVAHWNVFAMMCSGTGMNPDTSSPESIDEALRHLEAAARGDHPSAVKLLGEYQSACAESDTHGDAWLWRHLWQGCREARMRLVSALLDPDSPVHDIDQARESIARLQVDEDWRTVLALNADMLESDDTVISEKGRCFALRGSQAMGYPWTLHYLASLTRGDGGPRDMDEALRRLHEEASRHDLAQRWRRQIHAILSDIYAGNQGEQWRNDERALAHMRKAADMGDGASAMRLGMAHELGHHGLDAQPEQAAVWYRLAIDCGDMAAQTRLALLVLHGDINGDRDEAISDLLEADEAGDDTASQLVASIINDPAPHR